MSEYKVNDVNCCAGSCHLIFRKTLIWDDELVYDVFALIGGSAGKEIEVGTIDSIDEIDRFVDEFQSKSDIKVIGTSIGDYSD